MKRTYQLLGIVGVIIACVALSGLYTYIQVNRYSADGVYDTAEEGMMALIDKNYSADREATILYAGTNSFNGSRPYVWYVIAEVRASAHADGSALYNEGCESPGSYFLHTKNGWIHVPEGAFPDYMGLWMTMFNMAGPGQSEPSVDRAGDQLNQFCQ